MNEIARDTYDMERFQVVSSLMWDGLENQRPSAWKVVFKALNLLDHLVKNGAERCVDDARNHGHILRSLGQFNYYEGTIDRGLGVREKSKQVLEILGDDERVREERQKARKLREKFGNFNKGSSGIGSTGGGGGASSKSAGGYGNQDSWNSKKTSSVSSGGGYGEGGIYDEDKAYSGRYGNSSSTAAPTFAAMPGEKKKSKKKKKKPQSASKPEPVAAPAAPRKFGRVGTEMFLLFVSFFYYSYYFDLTRNLQYYNIQWKIYLASTMLQHQLRLHSQEEMQTLVYFRDRRLLLPRRHPTISQHLTKSDRQRRKGLIHLHLQHLSSNSNNPLRLMRLEPTT
jgi:epsin